MHHAASYSLTSHANTSAPSFLSPAQPLQQHAGKHSVATCSVRAPLGHQGISYVTSKKNLKTSEVAQLLATSTTCQAPDILHGSMAQAALSLHSRTHKTVASQVQAAEPPNIVLYPPTLEAGSTAVEEVPSKCEGGQQSVTTNHSVDENALMRRIEKGTQCSSAIVAAFAEQEDLYGFASSSEGVQSSQPSWFSCITPSPPRSLVGLARATSDESLVATIHEVCVHPKYRGRGIGRRLIGTLLRQILSKGIYDIGAVVPAEVQRFYTAQGFEKDREQSTVMKLVPWRNRNPQLVACTECRAGSQAHPQHTQSRPDISSDPQTPASQPCEASLQLSEAASAALKGVLSRKLQVMFGP
ncbi:hypothetical protein DUNSADRAFT_515 [Dunaliella salina]|uniref:N-acetyltransferase domain-containing protein n=1 Tax=Dunaliella salina TaxID=3046 RepID=A0ABQ7GY62_DUNSA|nr:hypothetical protein DUNSADRAFT_515 [Dunaliella salina]|eukprot:KAF5839542.1 hypothetical protein DUNSADRAFT_515 [Dunaliella salina]